jgi:CheY-like chemotaxis protein
MDKEEKRNILIVEDDENSYLYLLFALEEMNYNILRASNGLEAVNIFRASKIHIDLILMDLKLPLIDGFQASETIWEINSDVPIIVQTASYLPLITQKLKNYKFSGVIIKPYTVPQLSEAIKLVFESNNNFENTSDPIKLLYNN